MERLTCPYTAISRALLVMEDFNLKAQNITVDRIFRNASPPELYEEAIRHEPGTAISDRGALIAFSGE
ncbi:MAG: hypothetical protein O3A00_28815, partial [Planctomycetota bacterium]|nr:hypothetical protein [Planctomycetota bacterium]